MTKKDKKHHHHQSDKDKKHARQEAEERSAELVQHDDHEGELIVTPKGQSKLKFFLVLAAVIFVLVIITVGSEVQSVVGGGGRSAGEAYMTWADPGSGSSNEMAYQDFMLHKRALQRMAEAGFFRPADFDPQARRAGNVSDEETAMWILDEELARKAGIEVTADEMKELLASSFGTGDVFTDFCRRLRVTPKQFQEELKRLRRAQTYRQMLGSAVSIADPARVEELWTEGHPEYAFDYVEIAIEDLEEEAAQEVPEDEALLEWFRALPINRQKTFHTPDKFQIEVAWASPDESFDSAKLLERFPRPEGTDLVQLARDYYNQFSNTRFRVPQDEPTDDEEGDTEEQEDPVPDKWYYDFEEVEEQCTRESQVHAALEEWLADMQRRQDSGEEVDFLADAGELGLSFTPTESWFTNEELSEAEVWGSPFLAGQISLNTNRNALIGRTIVDEGALTVARFQEKQVGAEPPLDEMREKVNEAWAKERAAALALEKLEAVRNSFGEQVDGVPFTPTADKTTFSDAVAAAGFAVTERPYLEQNDFSGGVSFNDAEPADQFVMFTRPLFELEEGQVAAVGKNFQNTHAFLFRMAGKRTADISTMTPQELSQLRGQAIGEASAVLQREFFEATSEEVKERYGLHLKSWDETEEQDGES